MAVDVGSAVGYLDLDISGFLSGWRQAQSEAEGASKNIVTKVGNNLQGAGKSLTTAGKTLTATVTTPLLGLGGVIVKTSADFESSMSKVQAISGVTGDEFNALTSKAREMGAKTKFSAQESADAFTYMAMAGWKTNDMLNSIEGVMSLAAASGEDLASVSDIVTDAMTAFGMAADGTSVVLKDGLEVEVANCTRFVDVLAAASNNSNTNVSMLGESFKYVAPVAGALGYSVEDVAVALGLMANQGIKSSNAGTALRTVLTNMAKPTDTMAAAMQTLGVSLTDDKGNMLSLMDVMKDLRSGFGGGRMDAEEFRDSITEIDSAFSSGKMSEEQYEAAINDLCVAMYGAEGAQKAQLAASLAGKTGMAGLLAIVNTTEEEFNELAASIYNANGTADEMAATMQNNLSGQITILKSALQELALQFGEILLPHIKNLVSWLQQMVQKFSELSPQQKEQIVKWAALAAAIGPVLLVLGKLVTGVGGFITTVGKIPGAIKTVTGGMSKMVTGFKNIGEGVKLARAGFPALAGQASKLGAAIGGITAPVAAVIAVVAILAAAFATLWKTNEEFRNKMTEIWGQIVSRVQEFCQGIVDRINALGFDFKSITDVLWSIWSGFCDLLAPVFTAAFQYISDSIGAALDIITGILDVFIGLFTGNWEQLWNGLVGIFTGIWNSFVATFTNLFDALLGIFDVICGWFGTTWSDTWNSIKQFFVNIWDGITSFLSSAWETIKNVVQVGIMLIGEILSAAVQIITLPFRFIWENCKDVLIEVWEGIKEVVSNAINAVKSILEPILNGIKETFSTIWNAIKSVTSTVFNAIKGVTSSVWNSIKSTISSALDGIKFKVSSVVDAVKSVFSSGFNAAKSTVSSIFNSIKSTISSVMDGARNVVSNAIDKIKSVFNFSWSLPKLKLPHFSISGSFSLNPPSVPHFSIQWYKDAMANGMILNAATIFGMDKNGKFLGAGEAGPEAVVGVSSLRQMIESTIAKMFDKFIVAFIREFKRVYDFGKAVDCTVTFDRSGIAKEFGSVIDYDRIAALFANMMKNAPVPQVVVEMEDGDVYMDKERVGRKLAPVVSRVIVQPK